VIKGLDAQVMTHRAAEYTKDMSAIMRRDEVSNEFAGRMSSLNAEQEIKTVSQAEKAEQGRIDRDGKKGSGGGAGQKKKGQAQAAPQAAAVEHDIPSIGETKTRPLLDIEV